MKKALLTSVLSFYSIQTLLATGASIDSAGKGYVVRVVNRTDYAATLSMDNNTIKLAPKETLGSFNDSIEKSIMISPLVAIEMKTKLVEESDKDAQYLQKYGITRNTGAKYNGTLEKEPTISGFATSPINGFFGTGVTIIAPMFGKGMARIVATPGLSPESSSGIDCFKNSPDGVTLSFYIYSQDQTDISLLFLKTQDDYIKINLSSKQEGINSISKVSAGAETVIKKSEQGRAMIAGRFTKVWISITKNALLVGTGQEGEGLLLSHQDNFAQYGQFGFITGAQPVFFTYATMKKPLGLSLSGQTYFNNQQSKDRSLKNIRLREKGLGAIKISNWKSGTIELIGKATCSLTLAGDRTSISFQASGKTQSLELKNAEPNFVVNLVEQKLSLGTALQGQNYQLLSTVQESWIDDIQSIDYSKADIENIEIDHCGKWLSIDDSAVARSISSAALEVKKWFQYKVSQSDQAVTITETSTNKSYVLEKCPQQGAIYPFELVVDKDGTPTISLFNSTINPQRYAYGLAGATLRVAELYAQTYSANMTSEKQDELKVDVAVTVEAMGILLGGAALGAAAAAMEALNKEGFRNSKESFVYKEKFKQKSFEQSKSDKVTEQKTTISSCLDKLSLVKYVKTEDLEYACNLIDQLLSCITDERSLGDSGTTTKTSIVTQVEKMVAYGCKGLLKATKSVKGSIVTFGPSNHDTLIDMLIDAITKILANKFLLNLDSPTDRQSAATIYQQLCKCTQFKFIKFMFNNGNLKDSSKIISEASSALVDKKISIAVQETTALATEVKAQTAPQELLFSDSRNAELSTGLSFSAQRLISKKVLKEQLPGTKTKNAQELTNELAVEFDLINGGGAFSVVFVRQDGTQLNLLKNYEPFFCATLKENLIGIKLSKNGTFVTSDNDLEGGPNQEFRPSSSIAKRYKITFKDGTITVLIFDSAAWQQIISYQDPYYKASGNVFPCFVIDGQASLTNFTMTCGLKVLQELEMAPEKLTGSVYQVGPSIDFYKEAKQKYDEIIALAEDTRSELSKFDDIAGNKILSASGIGLNKQGEGLQSYGTIDDAAQDLEWGALDWSSKESSNYSRESEQKKAVADRAKAAAKLQKDLPRQGSQSLEAKKTEEKTPEKGQLTGQDARQQAMGVSGLQGDIADLKHWGKDIKGALQRAKGDSLVLGEDEEDLRDRNSTRVRVPVRDENGRPRKDAQGNDMFEEKSIFKDAFETGKSTKGQSKNFFINQLTGVAAQAGSVVNTLKGKDIAKVRDEIKQLNKKTVEVEEEVDNDDEATKHSQPKKKVKKTISMDEAKKRGVKTAHEKGKDFNADDNIMIVMKVAEGLLNAGKDNVNEEEKKSTKELQERSLDLSQIAGIN